MTEKELIVLALDRADTKTIHYIWAFVRALIFGPGKERPDE